jgi:hydroxyacylglutathione hydrolase
MEFLNRLDRDPVRAKTRVLDVRKPSEHTAGRVEGAENIPLDDLNAHMDKLSRGNVLYIHCASGYRSMIAASILKARGFDNVVNVEGGYNAIAKLQPAPTAVAEPADSCCSVSGGC